MAMRRSRLTEAERSREERQIARVLATLLHEFDGLGLPELKAVPSWKLAAYVHAAVRGATPGMAFTDLGVRRINPATRQAELIRHSELTYNELMFERVCWKLILDMARERDLELEVAS